jgi:recombination protein RecR
LSDIDVLIQRLARLPGLGPRSGRRAALYMLKRRDTVMEPLLTAMKNAAERVRTCSTCGNLDASDPCAICDDPRRDGSIICVVEDVADLWALERTRSYRGLYHVLGGTLSAVEGIRPEDLNIPRLVHCAARPEVKEIILATSFTVDGQTTAHYIIDRLKDLDVTISALAQGVPLGGELDYLDDATLATALKARRGLS